MVSPRSGPSRLVGRPLLARIYRKTLAAALAATAALWLSGCQSGPAAGAGRDTQAIRGAMDGAMSGTKAPVTMPAASGWQSLFDGTQVTGWHNFKTPGQPVAGWEAVDGLLTRTGQGGDLTSDKLYGNFELELEWMVGPGGNSGIIYRIDPAAEVSYVSGPEMQILDDAVHRDGKNPLTSAGANYALHAPTAGVVKPANSWNAVRLLVNGNHVEHWLNGVKVVEYELGSADWETRRAASKFTTWERYGRAPRGYIALQDHGDRVFFRNIRIRELPE